MLEYCRFFSGRVGLSARFMVKYLWIIFPIFSTMYQYETFLSVLTKPITYLIKFLLLTCTDQNSIRISCYWTTTYSLIGKNMIFNPSVSTQYWKHHRIILEIFLHFVLSFTTLAEEHLQILVGHILFQECYISTPMIIRRSIFSPIRQ